MFDQEHYDNLRKGLFHWRAFILEGGFQFKAKLQGANLQCAHLGYTQLREANLKDAALDNADLTAAILAGANMSGASLKKATLKNTNLNAANLQKADLTLANLTGADLTKANLKSANLAGAMLDGALLDGALVLTASETLGKKIGEPIEILATDLREVHGLTQAQVDVMRGDSSTLLPDGIERPAHWRVLFWDRDQQPSETNARTPSAESIRKKKWASDVADMLMGRVSAGEPVITPSENSTPSAPPFKPGRFVFLSYKREDRPWVQNLRDTLIQNGISVWWDDDIPFDQNWDDEIDTHLEAAEIVLTVWTDKSIASREVKNEALYAIRNNKLVQVQMGNPKLGPRYEAIQCADLTAWSPAQDHPDFDRLIGTLRRRLEG